MEKLNVLRRKYFRKTVARDIARIADAYNARCESRKSETTSSQYITIYASGASLKVRVSDHRPCDASDCDICIHPGSDKNYSVVRRWIQKSTGIYTR